MGLHRVEIRCAIDNHRSRAVPHRLGFRLEGQMREAEWLYNHWVDHAVYAGLATDHGLVETLVHQPEEAPDQTRDQHPISP